MLDTSFPQSENQVMLEQSLGRYLSKSYDMAARGKVIAHGRGLAEEHWQFFAEMGLLGLTAGEDDGGLGGELADFMLISRLFGHALVVEPYHENILVAARLIAASQDGVQRESLLPSIIAGERLVGFAHLERSSREFESVPSTVLEKSGEGWILNGEKTLVAALPSLQSVLVSARTADGALRVCLVDLNAVGLSTRDYPGIDGRHYGDLILSNVQVDENQVLDLANAESTLSAVLRDAEACLCAEAIGIMDALQSTTVEYAQTRKQFGVPIGSFQAIKHRLVDCYNLVYQGRHLAEVVAAEGNPERARHLDAMVDFICEYGPLVGHEAIQIHGGMGVTDELAVSHYHKRLSAIVLQLGGGQFKGRRTARDAALLSADRPSNPAFSVYLGADENTFRGEVTEFINGALSDRVRDDVRRQVMAFTEPETTSAWLSYLQQKGWQAPLWPSELGGTGWNPIQRFVYEYETGQRDVPELVPMGFRYVGPVIAHFGSDWQKATFLPRILSGEDYWAQGFSEPGAGSDLVALKTTAELDGDEYVINGTKIWTTHAHHANWLFCLARTDKDAPPHKGIGFFLVPLDAPGITVESIPLMTGPREVNQVFLDNVRIPSSHLVGDPRKGWEYTKFLLEFERGGAVFCGRARSELDRAAELVRDLRPELLENTLLREAIAGLEVRLTALELLEYRHAAAMQAGGSPGVGGSITKLLASELRKDIAELMARIVDVPGLEYQDGFLCDGERGDDWPATDLELVAMPRYLNIRAESIYGGSSEVQREIIAKAVLGLR